MSIAVATVTVDQQHHSSTYVIAEYGTAKCDVRVSLSPSVTYSNQALTAVLLCILVAMVTFMLHAALCFLTRKWAYRAALQSLYSTSGGQHRPPHSKKKRLRKRRPRLVQLPQHSSSSDCSF